MHLWCLANPKSAGLDDRLETQEEANAAVLAQRPSAAEFPLAWKKSVFCYTQAFKWLAEQPPHPTTTTHIVKKSTLLKGHKFKC